VTEDRRGKREEGRGKTEGGRWKVEEIVLLTDTGVNMHLVKKFRSSSSDFTSF